MPLDAVTTRGWTLDDLPLPVMTLRDSALTHNLSLMAGYCRDHGVALAPHGKTTMAPALWRRQLEAGAWGITAANATQARAMRDAGVPRVLIANEVVDAPSLTWLARANADPAFDLLCYVDSFRGIEMLETALAGADVDGQLPVLVELGFEGGRTGCRSVDEALELAARARASVRLRLAGVSGYEGVLCHERSPDCLARVWVFVDRLADLARAVIGTGPDGPSEPEPFVVSAGGSLFFDVVTERLGGPWPGDASVLVVLRSGCYLTHDHGIYERSSPMPARDGQRGFRPALELWSGVLSRPEPGLALLGFGKRDAPHDLELPIPTVVRTGDRLIDPGHALTVEQLNDQHAFVRVDEGFPLHVGDVVGCGVSHPCTAFDKWRLLPVLDDEDRVVEAVATAF